MKSVFYIAISVYFGAVAGLITNDVIIGVLIGALFLIVLLAFVSRMVKAHAEKTRKKHETYRFINSFIVSLSVTQSLDQAFEDAGMETSGEEKTLIESTSNMPSAERLDYLKGYFQNDLYDVFTSIIDLYAEQGGDIIALSSNLLKEASLEEGKQIQKEAVARKALLQHGTLWFLSTIILAFLRYGLSSFYEELSASLPFTLLALAYFLIALSGIFVFAMIYTGEKPVFEKRGRREKNAEEKAKSERA